MRHVIRVLLPALTLCLLAGCSSVTTTAYTTPMPPLPQAMPVDPPPGSDVLTANIYAADAINAMLLARMGSGGGILAASFVEMDNYDKSSAFGRIASQQIGSRLGQHGYRVLEQRLGSEMWMNRNGEFILSRDTARLLSTEYDAHAVLVGVYRVVHQRVYVSARVVRLSDNVVLGAYEYYVPLHDDALHMLSGAGSAGASGDAVWRRYALRQPLF